MSVSGGNICYNRVHCESALKSRATQKPDIAQRNWRVDFVIFPEINGLLYPRSGRPRQGYKGEKIN